MLMCFQAFLDRGVGFGSGTSGRQIIGCSVPLKIGQRGLAQSLVNATEPDRVVGSNKVCSEKNGGWEVKFLQNWPGNVVITLETVIESDGHFRASIAFLD